MALSVLKPSENVSLALSFDSGAAIALCAALRISSVFRLGIQAGSAMHQEAHL
jgi:hypothetical protein